MWPFKKKLNNLPVRSLDDLKANTKILFIDDQRFNYVDALKEKDGWKNIARISDASSISQFEIKEAHIIFVDIQGVGKKLGFNDEGLELIQAIREQYPEKKIIMYSAENKGRIDGLHPAGNLVDYRLRKTASRYEFENTIERFAKEAFCIDNCVSHIREVFQRELGISKTDEEIKNVINILYSKNKYKDSSNIAKAFGLDNVGSIANIIQLLLTAFGA